MIALDRIARLGRIATASLAALSASACAGAPGREAVSTTSTTSAERGSSVELYLARQPRAAACGTDLHANIAFLPDTVDVVAGEEADIDSWAQCLNQPGMVHTTVVLVGTQDPEGPPALFVQRASRIRDALIMRGVDPRRIVIGAPTSSRGTGPYAYATGVRVEVTHQQTLRGFAQPDEPKLPAPAAPSTVKAIY